MVHGRAKVKRFPTRHIDVLWKTKHHLVEKEITRLREEEGRMNSNFELRTTASKNVIENMTARRTY